MLCSFSLHAVLTRASVVSRKVRLRSSSAFCSVLLGVSLTSKSSAMAALLECTAHSAAIDGPFDFCTLNSLIASHSFFAASALLIASLGHRPSLVLCDFVCVLSSRDPLFPGQLAVGGCRCKCAAECYVGVWCTLPRSSINGMLASCFALDSSTWVLRSFVAFGVFFPSSMLPARASPVLR